MDARLIDLDGLMLPTTAIVAPTIAEVSPPRSVHAEESAHPGATPR